RIMNCDVCGLPAPEDEIIQFEGHRICTACKPTFVQQLKEGVLAPAEQPLPVGFNERALSMGELIKLSWRAVCANWPAIVGLVLVVALPINFLLSMLDSGDDLATQEGRRAFQHQQSLETLVGVLSSLSIARIVSGRLQGKKVGFFEALLHAVSRWLPGVW